MTTTYTPIYKDRSKYEQTLGMDVASASIFLGCSTETVRPMRRYFENPDEFLTLTEKRNERDRRARAAAKQESRTEQEFDATPFQNLVDQFAQAILTDTDYAIAIAEDHRALQNGWHLRVKAENRCHECAARATTLRGYCNAHSKMKK